MDDCNHANQLHTIPLSVLSANHKIPIPPPYPDKSKMHPPPTPPMKGKEKEQNGAMLEGF